MEKIGKEVWTLPYGTLSLNNAIKEYGLTREDFIAALKSEILQYKVAYAHGNPYYKLIRQEVEELAKKIKGSDEYKKQKLKAELATVDTGLRKHRRQINILEKRKKELEEMLNK